MYVVAETWKTMFLAVAKGWAERYGEAQEGVQRGRGQSHWTM